LVPHRPVCYFAAHCKNGKAAATLQLLERSQAVLNESLRQSALLWEEGLGKLVVQEQVTGRSLAVNGTYVFTANPKPVVPFPVVAWSVARLYRFPNFPRCETQREAKKALQAFSARQQKLMLHGAKEVLG
jgi:hypothetical protein